MSLSLVGRAVLLTGASGGLGGAIARELYARGAKLKLSARRTEVLDALRAELGGATEAIPSDLADAAQLTDLTERVGAVDVVVVNAALPASGRVETFTPDEIDRALDVNLRAPLQLVRALVPGMLERGAGHLVFVSSLSGKIASARSAVYSATKFGLRGLAAGLREDLRDGGVGVTTVFPAFVSEAGMWADAGVKLPRGVSLVSPEQVARAVVRGIERGRAEIDVAPLPLRAGAMLAAVAPTLAAAVQRRLGAEEVAERLAQAQRSKR